MGQVAEECLCIYQLITPPAVLVMVHERQAAIEKLVQDLSWLHKIQMHIKAQVRILMIGKIMLMMPCQSY